MSVAGMIDKVFYAMKDTTRTMTNSIEILYVLNEANREFRRQLLQAKPSLLYETESFDTVVGQTDYVIPHQPLRVVTVRYAGTKIPAIRQENIVDLTRSGNPSGYYMKSPTTISLYPIPASIGAISILSIRTATEWTDASTTGWIEEVEDGLINYVAAKILGQPLPPLPVTLVVSMIEDAPADVLSGYYADGYGRGGEYR